MGLRSRRRLDLVRGSGTPSRSTAPARARDTVIVLPGQQVTCHFDADNPGQWMTHCHNLYHAPESGMMAVLGYQA